MTDRIERLQMDQDRMAAENRVLADEKRNLESRLNHVESELNVSEMTKEHLRNDKTIVSTNLPYSLNSSVNKNGIILTMFYYRD